MTVRKCSSVNTVSGDSKFNVSQPKVFFMKWTFSVFNNNYKKKAKPSRLIRKAEFLKLAVCGNSEKKMEQQSTFKPTHRKDKYLIAHYPISLDGRFVTDIKHSD